MSIISVNGQSQVPPGFRFHPTEEELLQYYLRKKVAYEKIDLDVIPDVDLNKLEPWDIQEKCKIGSTPQNDWYFFSHKDKKYPTGTRTNRATAAGFWKATGRDKAIYGNSRRIGMRKTLVFYKGRAPHGQKSDWIMHEYRLLDDNNSSDAAAHEVEPSQEEGWVVCRTFKKKNHHKTLIDGAPMMMSSTSCTFMDVTAGTRGQRQLGDSAHQIVDDEGTLMEHILEYMGRRSTCRRMEEEEISYEANQAIFPATINTSTTTGVVCDRVFMKLPNLAENPKSSTSHDHHHHHPIPIPINNVQIQLPKPHNNDSSSSSSSIQLTSQVMNILANNGTDDLQSSVDFHRSNITGAGAGGGGGLSNWAALDRLVATHLNGQNETSSYRQLSSCFSTADIADPTNTTNGNSTTMVVGLCSPPSDQDLQLQHQLIRSSSHVNQQDYQNECELWSFSRSSLSFAAAHDPAAMIGSHTSNVHHVPI